MPLQLEPLAPLEDLKSLDRLEAPPGGAGDAGATAGTPMQLAVDLIDEDPDQPRTEFDDTSLAELAETIRTRGVKQPISVRAHPAVPGRWLLNFGARRLRASALAGSATIPAFIDEAADSYDQVIENEQREGLKPLDLALFVQRRLALGESQAEIARRMGKSKQYVTYATALIDAPDWLLQAYREGRCRGMRELHELRRLHAEHPQYVEAWASDRDSITRDRVEALRISLAPSSGGVTSGTSELMRPINAAGAASSATGAAGADAPPLPRIASTKSRDVTRVLMADLEGEPVIIATDAAPAAEGQVFVRKLGSAKRVAVDAARLRLLGFMRSQPA